MTPALRPSPALEWRFALSEELLVKGFIALTPFMIFVAVQCADAQTMLYSVRLQDYGYVRNNAHFNKVEPDSALTKKIGIDGSGRVYVGFSVRGEPKLHERGEASNIFRVLSVNPLKQRVERTLDFPTQSMKRVGVYVTTTDALLVAANDRLQLLGESGTATATYDAPPILSKYVNTWIVEQSPSGKTLLFRPDDHTLSFISTESLSPIARCKLTDPRNDYDTFNDSMMVKVYQIDYAPSNELVKAELCGTSERLWYLGGQLYYPFFLDETTLLETEFTPSPGWDIAVQKTDGKILWTDRMPGPFEVVSYGGFFTSARDGSRFAITVNEIHRGNSALMINSKIVSVSVVIYDAQTGQKKGQVKFQKPNSFIGYELALSPTGDMLAILKDDMLEVWKVQEGGPGLSALQ